MIKKLGLAFLALSLVLVGAGSAEAVLTLGATSLTTDGAFTVTSVAGTTANLFAANTTGSINIGGTSQTSGVTTILGGTGLGVLGGTTSGIALTPGTAGTINIGAAAGTGAITLGSSTAAQTVNIANGVGAAAQITNIQSGAANTAAQTVNVLNGGSGAAGTQILNVASGTNVAAATINLVTGNAGAAEIVNVGTGLTSGAGSKTVNVATGASTVGVNTVNVATGATTVAGGNVVHIADGTPTGSGTNLVTIGSTVGASALNLKSGSVGTIVTSADDNALTVGANGATNPVLQVDASTGSVATGLKVTGAAAGSSVTVASISSGTDEKLLLNSKGRSEIRLNSRTDSTTTGDFIGVQIKPGQGATKTANGVTGVEISPRLNDGVALSGAGASIIGAHIDAYLKGTTGNVAGDVRGAQIELVTDDAGARTITGDVTGLRFRSAFSAAGITGNFQAIKIEKPEAQTGSQTYDSVLTLTSTIPLVWNDDPATEPSTAAGYIKVIVNGQARYIQLYSTAPTD